MGFHRQEYWSGLSFPSPGDLPNPGIEPGSPTLQADALTSEPPGKPTIVLSQRIRRPSEGASWSTKYSEHTHLLIKFTTLDGHPQTIAIVTSKITDHRSHSKYNNEEDWNI